MSPYKKKILSSEETAAVSPQQTGKQISQNHNSLVDLQYQQPENLVYIKQGLFLGGKVVGTWR